MIVGRCPVLLLDANVPGNEPEDRELTGKLYQGDSDVRIRQEILLGIGGMRALRAVGANPTVLHLNEGHSAFALIERLRELREGTDLSFEAALEMVRAGAVFTTHTPVAAGHDEFHQHQVAHHLGAYLAESGFETDRITDIGRYPGGDASSPFCMTILALRGAAWRNGVSRLHGEVTRRMWQSLWHGVPWPEVPIRHVTNGVHLPTWVSRELADLLGRYLDLSGRCCPIGTKFGRVSTLSPTTNCGECTRVGASAWWQTCGAVCGPRWNGAGDRARNWPTPVRRFRQTL